MAPANSLAKKTWFDKFLDFLERACNKLPPPAIMFAFLFVIIAVISCICSLLGLSAVNPATQEVVAVANPFSTAGLEWFLKNMISNFTGFAPLGLVITMTLAIGLCEEGGLIITLLTDPLPGGDQRWGCIGTFIAVLGLLCLGVFLFLLLAGAAVVAVV